MDEYKHSGFQSTIPKTDYRKLLLELVELVDAAYPGRETAILMAAEKHNA